MDFVKQIETFNCVTLRKMELHIVVFYCKLKMVLSVKLFKVEMFKLNEGEKAAQKVTGKLNEGK